MLSLGSRASWLVALVALVVLATPLVYASDDDPLAPPDTSSPRATLKSFLENFEIAVRPYYERAVDYTPYHKPAMVRAVRTLDMSAVPPTEQRRLGLAGAVLIYEVLSRVELPPYEQIPDSVAMAALPPDEPRRWRVPRTEIEIARVQEGPRRGEYLFSPTTVELALEFYQRVRHRDYQPGTMRGLYERSAYEPGDKIPIGWIERLPAWMKTSVAGQVVWKWLAMVIVVGLWALLVLLAHYWTRTRRGEARYWRRTLLALALALLTGELGLLLQSQVVIVRDVYEVVTPIVVGLKFFFFAIAILNFGSGVTRWIVKNSRIHADSIDAHMIGLAGQLIAWLAVLGLVFVAAGRLGIPLAAVLASLGVGGLAVALAARPTLENLIAGITLYSDRPVGVGQWCQFEGVVGMIEQIGLRSTRLRRWDGNLVSVPNAKFAEYVIDNYEDVRDVFIRHRVRLRLDTTPEQLRYLLVELREMLAAHPKVRWPDVRLADFGESFLLVELRCYADTSAWSEVRAVREDILLRVLEIIDEAGGALAMPTQTTYVARAQALDEERQRASEQQVAEWRESDNLPFPDMAPERREALSGTLDYPPRGSVTRSPRKVED